MGNHPYMPNLRKLTLLTLNFYGCLSSQLTGFADWHLEGDSVCKLLAEKSCQSFLFSLFAKPLKEFGERCITVAGPFISTSMELSLNLLPHIRYSLLCYQVFFGAVYPEKPYIRARLIISSGTLLFVIYATLLLRNCFVLDLTLSVC